MIYPLLLSIYLTSCKIEIKEEKKWRKGQTRYMQANLVSISMWMEELREGHMIR